MAHTISHDEAQGRYVLTVEGEEAGFAAYTPVEGALDFNHTVIDPRFQGQGLSKILISAALDDVRLSGRQVYASCSAVAGFVDKNPEYKDLLAE
ncbi:GNAT family N-acetyltransferase [Corynebacterium lactis]|uniref:Acetyltransferase n=1 Tax=Corynebacterium lactis RW2-5 TaxID=1408189 RepID=A0A0K2H2M9_9CORY|nr:GNAT family N-acetyltransferase [Corynebacterium lactis]ALA67976.1 acetyltransferase [Corynebacterium lactis RW2-5]